MNEKCQTLKPLGRLCMTIGELPSSYVESMSYYEQLLWLTKFLQEQVIPVVNHNSNIVNELQDYVEHYFDNLDVQEEINNKLDDMAESGELTDIIAQYLQLAGLLVYDTISDLKSATNVANGSVCKTLGFNSINDGGSSYYKIRELINTDVVDEKKLIAITSSQTLVAEFMSIDKKINPIQFGAYGDGDHDDTEALQYTLDYANDNKLEVYLPTPKEYYKISAGLEVDSDVAGIVAEKYDYTGIIRPSSDDFTMLTLNVGMGFYMKNVSLGNETLANNNGILFSGDVGLTTFEHIRVYNLNGYGFKINNIWDSVLTDISIEKCGNTSEYAFSMNSVSSDTSNMTTINRLQVEQANTKAIYIDPLTLSCVINNIHSERASVVNGTNAWVLAGDNCTYNNVRLEASNIESKTQCGLIESYNSSYNNILSEDNILVLYEGGNGKNCLITASNFDYLEEKINQTGLCKIDNCYINEITVRTKSEIHSSKITKIIYEWTSATDYSKVFSSYITSVEKTSNDARYYIVDSSINNLYSDSVKDMFLSNCTIGALTNTKISYSDGKYINCTFNSTTNLDFANVKFINCTINGDCALLAGTNPYSFINTIVTGTIGGTFGSIPTTSPTKGTRTDNLIPTAGQPSGWVYDGTSWLSLGNLA